MRLRAGRGTALIARARAEADAAPAGSQKKGSDKSGTELQRSRESAAEIMRQKQAAGEFTPLL